LRAAEEQGDEAEDEQCLPPDDLTEDRNHVGPPWRTPFVRRGFTRPRLAPYGTPPTVRADHRVGRFGGWCRRVSRRPARGQGRVKAKAGDPDGSSAAREPEALGVGLEALGDRGDA